MIFQLLSFGITHEIIKFQQATIAYHAWKQPYSRNNNLTCFNLDCLRHGTLTYRSIHHHPPPTLPFGTSWRAAFRFGETLSFRAEGSVSGYKVTVDREILRVAPGFRLLVDTTKKPTRFKTTPFLVILWLDNKWSPNQHDSPAESAEGTCNGMHPQALLPPPPKKRWAPWAPHLWICARCMGKSSKHLIPNGGFDMFWMVIYHGTICKTNHLKEIQITPTFPAPAPFHLALMTEGSTGQNTIGSKGRTIYLPIHEWLMCPELPRPW